jgi:hypothetical protein
MPRQNRVTPFGAIVAAPERGTFMGNRGILHDEHGNIKRAYALKRWLVCVLEFRGRKRTVMKLNSYTELFFLDEATALAAGHRPCAECRHERFIDFCNAWKVAYPEAGARGRPTADEMDSQLHTERIGKARSKPVFDAQLKHLPNGAFITFPDQVEKAYLVWDRRLLAWSLGGYREQIVRPSEGKVLVLTPKSTIEVMRAGFLPAIHPSAGDLLRRSIDRH